MDDVDPARTAWREGYLKRNPTHRTPEQLEELKANWAKEDAEEKTLRDENIDRKVFQQRVLAAKNAQQLAEGRPLDTGIISKIYDAAGNTPSQAVSPEALAASGAQPVNEAAVNRMAAATDPSNLALAVAPMLPGASYVGGKLTQAAGKVARAPMAALEAAGSTGARALRRLGPAGKIAAGAAAGAEGLAHVAPAVLAHPGAAAVAGAGVGAAKGLQAIGKALEAQGGELATGIPGRFTNEAATAAARGERAIGANIARKTGDIAAHGATTAAAVAPLNLALSEGDPKKFAELQAGAATFGGALNAFRSNRSALVEGVRPHLRSEGARALAEAGDSGDQLAQKSAAYLFSLPEAARDSALEAIGTLQGLPIPSTNNTNGIDRARVYVLSEPDFLAEQNKRLTAGLGFLTDL